MDYLSKLFKLQDLAQKRLEQLNLESEMDNKLFKTYKECPETTFKFIMSLRNLNRQFSSEIYSSSIFDYHDKIIKNINFTDSLYLLYFTNPTCENISKLL